MSRVGCTSQTKRAADAKLVKDWTRWFDRLFVRLAVLAVGLLVATQALTTVPWIRAFVDETTSGFSFTNKSPILTQGRSHIDLYLAPSQLTSGIQVFDGQKRLGDFANRPILDLNVKNGDKIRIENGTPYPCLVTALTKSKWEASRVVGEVYVKSKSESVLSVSR